MSYRIYWRRNDGVSGHVWLSAGDMDALAGEMALQGMPWPDRRLPEPGSDQQLLELLQRLHCGVLGRDRPGWIFQVIEGLEGDRFALYSKIHHAYIDGMSGVKRMYGSLSASPDETRIQPTWSFNESRSAKPSASPRRTTTA